MLMIKAPTLRKEIRNPRQASLKPSSLKASTQAESQAHLVNELGLGSRVVQGFGFGRV